MLKTILWRAWLGVAVLLAAVGCLCLVEAYKVRRAWHRTAAAVPASFPVNLAETGSYSGTFSPTHPRGFTLQIRLKVDPPFSSHRKAEQALTGLQARLTIGKPDSETGLSQTLSGDRVRASSPSHSRLREPIPGPYFPSYGRGPKRETRAVLAVEEPATGLEGREQRLVIRYALCGEETGLWPLTIAVFGGLLALPGFVTGIIVLSRLYRRRWRGRDTAQAA